MVNTKNMIAFMAVIVTSLAAQSAHSSSIVLWDQSPDTIGGTLESAAYSNTTSQYFTDPVQFSQAVSVTGFDVYMSAIFANVGDEGVLVIGTGAPDSPLSEYAGTVSEIDTAGTSSMAALHRVHVDFEAPILLEANQIYWVGMHSGPPAFWAQAGIVDGVGPLLDNLHVRFDNGEYFGFSPSPGDTVFRVWGSPVPVPAAIWLMVSGLLGLSLFRRQD